MTKNIFKEYNLSDSTTFTDVCKLFIQTCSGRIIFVYWKKNILLLMHGIVLFFFFSLKSDLNGACVETLNSIYVKCSGITLFLRTLLIPCFPLLVGSSVFNEFKGGAFENYLNYNWEEGALHDWYSGVLSHARWLTDDENRIIQNR